MTRSLQIAIAASGLAIMAGSLSGKAGKGVLPKQTLSIHLQNDSVNPQTLHWATFEANRLLGGAAVEIRWQQLSADATKSREKDGGGMGCPQMNEPRYIMMRLMRKAPVTVSDRAIGAARPFAQTGTQIEIFIERVEFLAQFADTPLYVILGHAMAHEIGHVLLGSVEHSRGGLMDARWTTMSLHLASKGLLAFGRKEAERMNARLAALQSCGTMRDIASNNRSVK